MYSQCLNSTRRELFRNLHTAEISTLTHGCKIGNMFICFCELEINDGSFTFSLRHLLEMMRPLYPNY